MRRALVGLLTVMALAACARGPAPAVTPTAPVEATQTTPIIPTAPFTYQDELISLQPLTERRAAHTATLLPDGRVLLAGGFQEDGQGHELAIDSAELYDPRTDTFTRTGPLNEARDGHTATLLPDGRVLLVGGWGTYGRLATAEIYDLATEQFTLTGSLSAPRAGMTASLLEDGRVLIAGGQQARNAPLLAAEIYDPRTGQFSLAAELIEGREGHTALTLPDGRILLAGGTSPAGQPLASAELFDPNTSRFIRIADLTIPRHKHAAVLLETGVVLLLGGSDERDWRGQYHTTELFDPLTLTFQPGPDLNNERFKLAEAAVLLANGDILVSGGNPWLEVFNVGAGRFHQGRSLDDSYYFATATRLSDGRVLIAGGYNPEIEATDQAWLYR